MFKVKNKEQRSVSLELFWYCLLRTGRRQRVDSGKKKNRKICAQFSRHCYGEDVQNFKYIMHPT